MKTKHFGRRLLSLLLAMVMLFSLGTVAFAADTVIATDDAGGTYTSVSAAWSAAKKGKVITLKADWKLSDRLKLGEGESATINLNGLRIDRQLSDYESDGEVIYLDEGATLTLTSPKQTNVTETVHTFYGWYEGGRTICTVTCGGLVTGGWSSNGAGGVHMKAGSKLTLDNVAIAGNCAEITWGADGYGGGVMMDGTNCTLIMKNNAQIAYNEAQDEGGGVYCNAQNNVIEMSGGASIHDNRARDGGGGVYFCYGCFSIISEDLDAKIYNNKARSGDGGGIFVEQCLVSANLGVISGITLEDNEASGNGGAIYLNQENITVSGCTIKRNKANYGGGIYNNNDSNTLSACTIEDNTASSEGGGVYAAANADIALSGIMYIRNNTRTNGTKDDLFLNDSAQTAYLTSSPSGGSKVGIRTTTTDRDLNEDKGFYYEKAFFSDFDGYVIKYDSTTGILRYYKGEPEPDPVFTEVQGGTTTEVGTYNGLPVIEGYFRYAAVLNTQEELSSNYYYSDGYFLDGSDALNGDPNNYNEHLASLSMALVLAGCFSNIGVNNDITDQAKYNLDYTYKSQNIETVLTDIGIDPDDIYLSDTYTTKPGSDTMSVAIGQKQLEGSDKILVPIVVRSVGYESEWASNFTLGTSGEAAGFASAAKHICDYLDEYIENYDLQDALNKGKVKFWIMGYSRGGGTANLAAKRIVETYCYDANGEPTYNQLYAYCIAAPQGGTVSSMKLDASAYYCIHNVINKVDPVPEVAPDEMGLLRYGVDHYVPGGTDGEVQEDKYVWSFVANKEWMQDYMTMYDNESWTVGSASYNTQREKMIAQLNSVDPVNIQFNDYFGIAEQDILPSGTDPLTSSGTKITQEEYIHVLLRAIQAWGLYDGYEGNFREGYSDSFTDGNNKKLASFESAVQVIVPIYYNLTNEQRSAMMTAISYGASDMLSGFSAIWNGVPLYDDVIGDWCTLSQDSRDSYLNEFWDALMCTKYPMTKKAAVDYLTTDQKSELRAVWNVLMDVILRFVSGDYNNDITDWATSKTPVGGVKVDITEHYADSYKNYGNHALAVLGTILYNTDSISQGHFPEINFAWLRSYDSFYDNDGNKPITVVTDKTPSVEVEVENNVMTLTTDVKGAGMFYRLSKDGTTYGNWMPYNRAVSVDDYKYVQTTAIYCGKYCPVVTTDLTLANKHVVTVNGTEVGKYAKDSEVTVDGSDSEEVFKSWNELEGITDGKDLNNAVLTFVMPDKDVALTANYVTRITDVTLTVDVPVAGKELPTMGTLSWTDANGEKQSREVGVYWLEQVGEGTDKQTQLATGTAKYATKYSVAAIISQKPQEDLAFSTDITKANAKVVYGTKETQAYQAETDAAGALLIYGDQVETGKGKIKDVPEITVAIAQGSEMDTLKAKLPKEVTVTLEDDTYATLELDQDVGIDAQMLETGGYLMLDIKGTDTVDAEDKVVRVHVTISAIAAPTFSYTVNKKGVVHVSISAEAGATIKFKVNGGSENDYEGFGGYNLTPKPGEKRTDVIVAWAEKDGGRSSDAVFTYEFDNPFTVTVDLKDTAESLSGWKGETKTYKYYKGDKVTIAAPVEDGELFYQWESVPTGVSGKVTDNSLTVDSIENDISVTAIYTPVIKALDITMDEPKATKKLAENIDDASFTITNTYKLSKMLEGKETQLDDIVDVTWIPDVETAGYGTAYIAKITVKSDIKFFLADNIKISVNDNEAIKTSTAVENGKNVIYVTFPATGKAELSSVAQPETVVVAEAQAKAGNWGLPQTATITYSDGSTEQRAITWTVPEYVANQLSYTATGTVDLEGVNNPNEVSGEVEVKILVTAEESGKPAAPTADLVSGSYEGTQYVRLSCSTEGAVIYYTTDGKDPTTSSTKYQADASIKIASTTTLKAIAVKNGQTSEVATYTYTITDETPTPEPSDEPTPTPTPTDPVTPDDGYKKCPQDNTCPIARFTDSNPKAWYHDGVHFCLDEGLMKGVSATEFAPNETMTRAQLVTILWRLDGEKSVDYSMTFKDVSADSWYTEAVRWAASEGIVLGFSADKFGPNYAVTREQLATILWRYAKYKGMDVSSGEDTNIMDYNDVTSISSYAVSAMQWAVAEGIINGTDNVTLAPLATATRAQAAAIFQRFCGLKK